MSHSIFLKNKCNFTPLFFFSQFFNKLVESLVLELVKLNKTIN